MLKPNYARKLIAANYSIGHGHGNHYFDCKGTRRINELLINGFSIRFIPHYDLQKIPFPPSLESFDLFTKRMPKNMQETRVHCFEKADLVFFEYTDKAGESFPFEYEQYVDVDQLEKKTAIVHCIESSLFKTLTDEMQGKMPYIVSDRQLRYPVTREDIKDLKFVQFLDAKFVELKDLLPEKLKTSLVL